MKVLVVLCVLAGMVMADDDDYRYVYTVPTQYNFGPVPYTGAVFPYAYNYNPTVVHPGYVAKTRGSEHRAPLPQGLGYASHHINVAPAPGSYKQARHEYDD